MQIVSLVKSCWTQTYPVFANRVDPNQLASEEANWSGSALFVIQYVYFYQQSGLSNLIGWQLKIGVDLNLSSIINVSVPFYSDILYKYRIQPNYHTVHLGFSKLLETPFVVKYVSTY